MHAFDFLNVKKIIDTVFNDRRKVGHKTAYRRFMELKRGFDPTIEDYELIAFYEQYKADDKTFRSFMDNLLKSK